MATKKVTGSEARKLRGATEWRKVESMSDAEISNAVKLDPGAREFRQDELMQFRREKKR